MLGLFALLDNCKCKYILAPVLRCYNCKIMRHEYPLQLTPVTRLGSADVNDRVCQASANVRLEGLRPHKRALPLAHAIASGEISTASAIEEIHAWYGCKP